MLPIVETPPYPWRQGWQRQAQPLRLEPFAGGCSDLGFFPFPVPPAGGRCFKGLDHMDAMNSWVSQVVTNCFLMDTDDLW